MHFSTALSSFGILASFASAAPYIVSSRQAPGAQNVVYWGQNGGGTIENNDLSAYCASNSGIDILVLAFLYQFGNGNNIASGTIGQSCFITNAGVGQNCDALSAAISTCKARGVKIILSLGGASSSWGLQSQSQAQTIGQNLWEAYGNTAGTSSVPRPFGSNFVDGWDFDIESQNGNQYFQYMISQLRSNFASDPGHTYHITGAPQCPIPEPNMGQIITSAQFDYLFVQFYNNNNYTYPCALGFNGNAAFNYNQWVSYIAGTPSANAKIFIGVPAAPLAANGAPSGEEYYITPTQLASLVGQYKSNSAFGGIMMWNAGFSDSNVNDGCTYAQEAHSILVNGAPCGASGPPPPVTTIKTTPPTSATTTTSAKATATGAGTVPQWGQCGGQGYTGPTQCVSPYQCVANSIWWAQCQ